MRSFAIGIRGLSARTKPTLSAAPRRIIDINLLPADRRPVDVSPVAVAVVVVLLLCIAAMVPLAFRVHEARASAASMEHQAADAERGVKALQLNLTRQRGLAGELDAAKARLAKFHGEREAFQGGKRPLSDDLTMLFGFGAYLPPGVRVMTVTGTDHAFKIDGTAPGPLDAITYAERLVKSGGFPSAHLASFAPGAKDGGQFTIEVAR